MMKGYKIQALIDKQQKNLAEVEYLDLDFVAKIRYNPDTAKISDRIMTIYAIIDTQNVHYCQNSGYFFKKVHPIS